MDGWQKLKIPSFCERIIGFSVPQNKEVLIISYDGIHLLKLDFEITVENDDTLTENEIYNPETGIAKYKNREYKIIGLHGGEPVLTGLEGERLLLDTDTQTLSASKNQEMIFSVKYKNFSDDWAAATFSPDGHFIILGCPYGFDFLVFRRESRKRHNSEFLLKKKFEIIAEEAGIEK